MILNNLFWISLISIIHIHYTHLISKLHLLLVITNGKSTKE